MANSYVCERGSQPGTDAPGERGGTATAVAVGGGGERETCVAEAYLFR